MPETPYRSLGSLALYGTDPDGVTWSVQGPESSDWWASAASTASVIQRPRAHGAFVGRGFLDPARYVVVVQMHARTEAGLRRAIDRLHAAASLAPTTLTVTEDGGPRTAVVQREDQVLVRRPHPLSAVASVQLVAPDPRKMGVLLTANTGLPSTSGGLTIPFTVPFTIGATQVTGQVSLTNPGNIAGPVRLRIDGPVTAPVVTHVGTGRSLVFASSLVLGWGEFVVVDMERHEVLAQGQASRNQWVTERGWSAFEPGPNTWAFSAADPSTWAKLTVEAVPSWM